MGVPAFFRWLSEKYPKVVEECLEKRSVVIDGQEIPVDLNEANPNHIEYDNLYIDMNGLIHPCSHPEDREPPSCEEEMYVNITKYIDRLFAAIRPRKLLFLAIDGIAPRAKMNQQRARRFRAVQDALERQTMLEQVREEMSHLGMTSVKKAHADWDSNVITPGTEFMYKLSMYIWFYVLSRMNSHSAWRDIQVIFSDASEPGEGEHKIMNFIRCQRNQPGYNPNQRHVLHGLDADLIMLALATHEPYFTILREKVLFNKNQRDKPTKSDAQRIIEAEMNALGGSISSLHPEDEWVYSKPLEALHINILREYLYAEFQSLQYSNLPFGYDFERIIDDFVFMCFFVGNDFLPHLPSLDIRDGAIDFLLECYKRLLHSLGDYLTSPGGKVNLSQVDIILAQVGEIEDETFKRKHSAEAEEEKKREYYRQRDQNIKLAGGAHRMEIDALRNNVKSMSSLRPVAAPVVTKNRQELSTSQVAKANSDLTSEAKSGLFNTDSNQLVAKKLRDSILGKRSVANLSEEAHITEVESIEIVPIESIESIESTEPADEDEDAIAPITAVDTLDVIVPTDAETKEEFKKRIKEKQQSVIEKYKQEIPDNIRFYEQGWKDRYYQDKYKQQDIEQGGGLKHMCHMYVKGLCWVLKYYYEGCVSWDWFYPFHYAPFASDLVNIDQFTISFELSEPFRPIEQLLAVLPSESAHALPKECQSLMTSTSSPIFDIYVSDAPLDPNGKHLPWLWVLLLPFIEEKRIKEAFQSIQDNLSLDSRRRNAFGYPMIFVHREQAIAKTFQSHHTYESGKELDIEVQKALKLEISEDKCDSITSYDCIIGNGICGSIDNPLPSYYAPLDQVITGPTKPAYVFEDIVNNQIICLKYSFPIAMQSHQSILLPGLIYPQRQLSDFDLLPRRPPRLNKSRFNMLDILNSMNQESMRSYPSGNSLKATSQQFTQSYTNQNNHGYSSHRGANMNYASYESHGSRTGGSHQGGFSHKHGFNNNNRVPSAQSYQQPYQQPQQLYQQAYQQHYQQPQPQQPYQQSYQLPYQQPYQQQPYQQHGQRVSQPPRFSFNQSNASSTTPIQIPSIAAMRAQLAATLQQRDSQTIPQPNAAYPPSQMHYNNASNNNSNSDKRHRN